MKQLIITASLAKLKESFVLLLKHVVVQKKSYIKSLYIQTHQALTACIKKQNLYQSMRSTWFVMPCLLNIFCGNKAFALSLGEGFGFNGNILETNVLNLGVVLIIVFVVGGDSLSSTLDERKQSIAKNLERAEERAREAREKLSQARSQLETAQKKAADILEQGNVNADQEKKDSAKKKEEEISRLTKKKEELLYVEEEKAFFQVYERFVDRIIEKTKERLLTRLNSQTHTKVINSQISSISKLKQ